MVAVIPAAAVGLVAAAVLNGSSAAHNCLQVIPVLNKLPDLAKG
jgi:hypothetical protein